MKKIFKIIAGSFLPLVLAFVFVAGTFEVGDMLGAPGVVSYVLGSDGDYVPPAPTPAPAPKPARKAAKKANPMTVKGKTVTIKYAKVSKRTQHITRKTAMSISRAKGTVTYRKKSGNKKITINKKTGKITVKKGLKKGTYKLKVYVTASGTSKYKKKTVLRTVKIKVVKSVNSMKLTAEDLTVDGAELVNDAKVIKISDAVKVENAKGAITYEKSAGDDSITVDESTGDITLAKGLAPDTYVIEIKVNAKGNATYKAATKSVTVAIFVTEPAEPAESEETSDEASQN